MINSQISLLLLAATLDRNTRDIAEPSAANNPDAVGNNVKLRQGEPVTGTRVGEDESTLSIAQASGQIAKLKKSNIVKVEPMTTSLMPEGIDKALSPPNCVT